MRFSCISMLLAGLFSCQVSLAGQILVGTDNLNGNTVIQTSDRRANLLVPVDGAGERVCWFNGEKYSKGARLQAGSAWLECARENDYETNGALSWRPVGEAGAAAGKVTIQTGKGQ
ncbi:DUF1496 domain-containing protein [Pseudaeromonas sharmana]|uniref:DUF1496 domain-containing protein n=1 Tax=Pseudaeromonas sharmana TaxID=328412 RepID=A0ABV8CRQ9_9GAMM